MQSLSPGHSPSPHTGAAKSGLESTARWVTSGTLTLTTGGESLTDNKAWFVCIPQTSCQTVTRISIFNALTHRMCGIIHAQGAEFQNITLIYLMGADQAICLLLIKVTELNGKHLNLQQRPNFRGFFFFAKEIRDICWPHAGISLKINHTAQKPCVLHETSVIKRSLSARGIWLSKFCFSVPLFTTLAQNLKVSE